MRYDYTELKLHALSHQLTYAFMARRTGKTTLAVEMANMFQEQGENCVLIVSTPSMLALAEKRFGHILKAKVCTIERSKPFKSCAVKIYDDCTPGEGGFYAIDDPVSSKFIILRTPYVYDADGRFLRRKDIPYWRIWVDVPKHPDVGIEWHATERLAQFDGFDGGKGCREMRLEKEE